MNTIHPQLSNLDDYEYWLSLAREVEPLFGAMVDDPIFQSSVQQAIENGSAICVKSLEENPSGKLLGGVILSFEENEILWLAVTEEARGRGIGQVLLCDALNRLDPTRPTRVETFEETVPAGQPARNLYIRMGFRDSKKGGTNPAGIPTMIMIRPPTA